MSSEIFLHLTGVEGESLHEGHEGQIEIREWSWSISNGAPFAMKEEKKSSAVVVERITIEKIFDKASVTLAGFCTSGDHISDGLITCYKGAGDSRMPYLKIKLNDVMVKKINWPSKGEHEINNETVELDFASFEIIYKVQTNTGLAAKGSVHTKFDLQKHSEK